MQNEKSSKPVQSVPRRNERSRIAESVHMAAYEVYSHVFQPQQALVEGECRGGFGVGELIAYLYARGFPKPEWKMRVHEALNGHTNL
ncbi:hypothetical protein VN12_06465 [Pirellula sp. SH-Sr6A]|uniref:hypothetical protein n=1 Tax=Pirellula sp. SH-Sr6A TaxID=1632865 RepID=UPI00078C91ED|nr:hypothetical protein [Pirellula sp. SH-Sr6A]AMV31746.1 hypothetical protein VN12_06465 [Pirellula sp. SH-Sr6A]